MCASITGYANLERSAWHGVVPQSWYHHHLACKPGEEGNVGCSTFIIMCTSITWYANLQRSA